MYLAQMQGPSQAIIQKTWNCPYGNYYYFIIIIIIIIIITSLV